MSDSADAGRYVVLVVESDPGESAAICQTLSRSFDVVVSASGQEAIQILSAKSAHVICAAYPIPRMDSVRFLQRALSVTDPPCMLFLTSAAELKDEKLEGLSGAVARPYDPATLVQRVSRLCHVAETRRRVASARSAILKHQPGEGSSQ
jgi:DNA-binding response OmpR family regulator